MSGSLPQLQEHASARADEFCSRYVRPRRAKRERGRGASVDDGAGRRSASESEKFYRPRDPEASPFYQLVRERFDEFESVYPQRYQRGYGFWRPVIRASIDKFLKCGDLKYGFAHVRCPECGKELFVAFSCRCRGACPSCDKKRSLLLAHRLNAEVLVDVPHRHSEAMDDRRTRRRRPKGACLDGVHEWVFTMPRRLRVYFRYDR